MKRTSALFRAFSDPTRLRLLKLLSRGEWCVGDLVTVLDIPQPTVSRHLAYLRKSSLVELRKDGVWKYYRLSPASDRVHQNLLDTLNTFDHLVDIMNDARRASELRAANQGCCEQTR